MDDDFQRLLKESGQSGFGKTHFATIAENRYCSYVDFQDAKRCLERAVPGVEFCRFHRTDIKAEESPKLAVPKVEFTETAENVQGQQVNSIEIEREDLHERLSRLTHGN